MSTTEQIRDLALQLSAHDRASLARDLLQSLDVSESPEVSDSSWLDEIEDRAEAYEQGALAADDGQVSLERARSRFREGRGQLDLNIGN